MSLNYRCVVETRGKSEEKENKSYDRWDGNAFYIFLLSFRVCLIRKYLFRIRTGEK